MKWKIIESGFLSPSEIMAKDAELLAQLDPEGPPFLHFYEWSVPSLTFGYFTDISRHLNLDALHDCGLEAARRPTGGGIIFHLSDLAFSVLIPASAPPFSLNTLENYAYINQKVTQAIVDLIPSSQKPELLKNEWPCLDRECHSFCMAKPTQYDIMIHGKKVGGAAQRKTKNGFLHQGSLSLLPPPQDILQKVLKQDTAVFEAMNRHSYYLLEDNLSWSLAEGRRNIKKRLQKVLNIVV